VDILNLFWKSGITHLQDSPNIFHLTLIDNEALISMYPFMEGCTGNGYEVKEYITDNNIDNTDKSVVFDWYYKVTDDKGRTLLHYCKFCNGKVLYASENIPEYQNTGFYEHGKYPFIEDVLYPVEGSPIGFGFISIMKDSQIYIDKMNQIILKNAQMAGRKRFFVRNDSNVNEEEFANWSLDFVHTSGTLSDENMREIQVQPLPPFIANYMEQKIDELKETSGNRDFSQGSTTSGVTAASAIAALQEAGSKLSRDMIQTSYQAFEAMSYMVLELIRQFYDAPRAFRITGNDNEEEFIEFDNADLRVMPTGMDPDGNEYFRKPIFDIKIVAQKQSPFQRISQNELIKELFNMGMFNPQIADQALVVLDAMDFEGKDQIIEHVKKNAQMMQTIQMLQQKLQEVAGLTDAANGTDLSGALMQDGTIPAPEGMMQQMQPQGMPQQAADDSTSADAKKNTEHGRVAKARQKAATLTLQR